MITLTGKIKTGYITSSNTAVIMLVDNENVEYKCYLNIIRTPDLFDHVVHSKFGEEISLKLQSHKDQKSGEQKYIVYGN